MIEKDEDEGQAPEKIEAEVSLSTGYGGRLTEMRRNLIHRDKSTAHDRLRPIQNSTKATEGD